MVLGGLRSLPTPILELAEYLYTPVGCGQLIAANRRFRADLIYERYAFGNASGAVAAAGLRLPRVLEVNSPLVDELSSTRGVVFGRLARRLERRILSSAGLVCTVSRQLARIVEHAGVRADRVLVVPNGVHLNDYRYPATAADRDRALEILGPRVRDIGSANNLIAGFVGYFRRWHGLDLVLEACASARLDNLHLALVGDGEGANELTRLARELAMVERVHLVGRRPPSKVPDLLPAFDIAVLPSITRYASPLKLIEYMAAGLAIVAPDQPNIRELVQDRESALLFPPGDPYGLAEALVAAAGDSELRRRLGAAARALVEQRRLTWSDNVRRITQALEQQR
jgi:glycosyltransferase involved in cell wall biosynthesis